VATLGEWLAWHREFREAGLEHVRRMVAISGYFATPGKLRFARGWVWVHDHAIKLITLGLTVLVMIVGAFKYFLG
jgi:hypothetical protein